MGKGPDKSDYKPTEADRTSASVALAEYNFFKKNYDPLLRQLRDKSLTQDTEKVARGRANADTMQTLTKGTLNKDLVGDKEVEGSVGLGLTGQLSQATKQAKAAKNDQSLGVLAGARGQATTAQQGLSQVARIKTTEALSRAQNKMTEAKAKMSMLGQLGGAALVRAKANVDSGGTWYDPGVADPEDPTGGGKKRSSGIVDYLKNSWATGIFGGD